MGFVAIVHGAPTFMLAWSSLAVQPPLTKPDTIKATVTAVIAEESPRAPFFFGRITGLAIDKAGRVYVSDGGELHVAVFSGDGKPLTTIGRKGRGPGEFEYPTGPVIGPDDALYVRNSSEIARFVVDPKTGIASQFDRAIAGPAFAPWMSMLPTTIDRSRRIHFPMEWGSRGDRLQHNAFIRYALDGRKLDSLPVPMQPTARSMSASLRISAGTGRMINGLNAVPFHPMPVFTVSATGTMITSPSDSYLLKETDVSGRVLRTLTLPIAPTVIPAAERRDSARALARRIDSIAMPLERLEGVSEEVKAQRLPTTYPVFRSLSTAADGTIWARRWTALRTVSTFDVISEEGRVLRTVLVPADCATMPAPVIRDGVLACMQRARDTDAESVVIANLAPRR